MNAERMSDAVFESEFKASLRQTIDQTYVRVIAAEARRARASESALLARVAELERERDEAQKEAEHFDQKYIELGGQYIELEEKLAAANARADKAEAALRQDARFADAIARAEAVGPDSAILAPEATT